MKPYCPLIGDLSLAPLVRDLSFRKPHTPHLFTTHWVSLSYDWCSFALLLCWSFWGDSIFSFIVSGRLLAHEVPFIELTSLVYLRIPHYGVGLLHVSGLHPINRIILHHFHFSCDNEMGP